MPQTADDHIGALIAEQRKLRQRLPEVTGLTGRQQAAIDCARCGAHLGVHFRPRPTAALGHLRHHTHGLGDRHRPRRPCAAS